MTNIYKQKLDLVKLITEEQVQKRVKEIAEQINRDYKDESELVVIGVLKGAVVFCTDLIKHIDIPVNLEFVRLSSYGDAEKSSGKIKPVDLTLPDLTGKNVLVIEDIVDTGLTAKFFLDYIRHQQKVKDVRMAVLLDKPCCREHKVAVDYIGFEIDNKFVVGYGLDRAGYYRNLPYIAYFPNP